MKQKQLKIDMSALNAVKTYESYLKGKQLEKIARETGFVARSDSKLTGKAFLEMLVSNTDPGQEWSLNDQCDYLRDHFDISLRKQSLDERYNDNSVSFIKARYEKILQQQFSNDSFIIDTGFNSIQLVDSTSWQLPSHLSDFYRSNGGATSGSSVKVFQTIELLSFSITDLLITDGKQGDAAYWQHKSCTFTEGSLWIADMGFFSWDNFKEIVEAGADFLSRYKTNTALYTLDKQGNYIAFDINQWLKRSVKQGAIEITVYAGSGKEKIPVRLIAQRVPKEVREQRLKDYERRHQKQSKKGRSWNMTEEKKLQLGYNIYITSATVQKLPIEYVFHMYSLRWQIELLFKIWKSVVNIDKITPMSIHRFECLLYSRLIFILLSTELLSFIKSTLLDNEIDIEISEWKFMRLIKKTYDD